MQTLMKQIFSILLIAVMASCSSTSAKEKAGGLTDKKATLEKLKADQKKLNDQISKLQAEVVALDPSADNSKKVLVTLAQVYTDSFNHYIDLQGRIVADNIAMVAPRGMGGVIRAIYVRQGQYVNKGQLIMRLDNEIAAQQVAAAQSQIPGIEAQLRLAESVYERQQNLWKNNIGTEVQVLQAKTAVESIAAQLKVARSGISLAQGNAALSNVYAGISGTIESMNAKIGEFFSPQSAAMPQTGIRIINTGKLKVEVQVPESYLGKVGVGTSLNVSLREINKEFKTKVQVAGKLVDPTSRTFFIEGHIPQDKSIKANQIAKVQIKDYSNSSAVTIPLNILQTDENGKYIMVAVTENNKLVSRKKAINIGELYGDKLEVKAGLDNGDQIIVDGFQNLYDGQIITTSAN